MMNIVDLFHIERLSDIQLSKLLHHLLLLEATKNNFKNWMRSVPFNITTADAGSDGRMICDDFKGQWIKNNYTIFQNKATSLIPSKCKSELLLNTEDSVTKLKPQIEELVKKNGTYILFTNKAIADQGIKDRIEKFREAIKDVGFINWNSIQIDVYDANKIKDWTNEFISSILLVQSFNGISRPLSFMNWKRWGIHIQAQQIPFFKDDIIDLNCQQIQENILNEKAIRIVGHSGLGKTRLTFESFRDSDLANSLVYFDLQGSNEIGEIRGFIINQQEHQSGIIVIDNCDQKSHDHLSQLVKGFGQISIITIGYESAPTPNDLTLIVNRNNQRNIVQRIIHQQLGKTHSTSEIDRLANICEGYPWMGVKVSQTILKHGISNLKPYQHNDFFRKLLFGLKPENKEEYDIIRSCSVFSAFGFLNDHLNTVISLAQKKDINDWMEFIRLEVYDGEISDTRFREILLKYIDEGILERRGSFHMVKPSLLAVNLAADWLTVTQSNRILSIIESINNSPRLLQFLERFKDLDQIDKAKDIVEELWGVNGPFGKAEVLNSSWGSRIFRYVVEVNPEQTLKTLERIFTPLTNDEVISFKDGRREIVWALEKLCFRKTLFFRASKLLLKLAIGENESYGNNATGQFIHLFQISLAGTEANFDQRLDLVNWAISKNDKLYIEITLKSLLRGLETRGLSRMLGAEQQGTAILEDYVGSNKEWNIYRRKILKKFIEISLINEGYFVSKIKEGISRSIRGLLLDYSTSILDTILQIQKNDKSNNVWSSAIQNLRHAIEYDKHSEKTETLIEDTIQELLPTSIKNKLQLYVVSSEWTRFRRDVDGKIEYYEPNDHILLAQELIADSKDISPYLDILFTGQQGKGFDFGTEYASGIKEKDLLPLIEKCIKVLQNIENASELFFAGFLQGASNKLGTDKLVEQLIGDVRVRPSLLYFLKVINPSVQNVEKVFLLYEQGEISISRFREFQFGSSLSDWGNKDKIKFCQRLSNYNVEGSWIALSFIHMLTISKEEDKKLFDNVVYSIISKEDFLSPQNINSIETSLGIFHWNSMAMRLLKSEKHTELPKIISKQIIKLCKESDNIFSLDTQLREILSFLLTTKFKDVWNEISKAILSEYSTFLNLKTLIEGNNGNMSTKNSLISDQIGQIDKIINWCKESSDLAIFRLAEVITVFDTSNDDIQWHPLAKRLIDEFGHKTKLLSTFTMNIGNFGTVGSQVFYYENQIGLYRSLVHHNIDTVSAWAQNQLNILEKQIEQVKLREEDRAI